MAWRRAISTGWCWPADAGGGGGMPVQSRRRFGVVAESGAVAVVGVGTKLAAGSSGALWGIVSGRGVGYPLAVGEAVAKASVMERGFGRMAGRRGDEVAAGPVMMLGSWTPADVTPKLPALPGGEGERESSWMGEGMEAGRMGEWPPVEDPDETLVVRFRRLLPWLSWW